jgi:altronate dehydratase
MKNVRIIMLAAFAAFSQLPVKAQFVTIDPANIAASILNTASEIVQTASTAVNTVNNFKETVKIYEQGKEFYEALKSVNNLIQDAKKVQKSVLLVGEISEIYVTSFQKIISDENFTPQEVVAIGNGYSILLNEGSDMLSELKEMITKNGLSMNDAERMAVIDRVYRDLKKYRDLVSYYSKKNISISFIRAKKKNDTARVMALYGGTEARYW